MGELLTKEGVAELLRISVRTLDRWAARGEAPPRVEITRGCGGYRREALLTWLVERETQRPAALERGTGGTQPAAR
jgi:predicted DNA-binding transcriptional regulator AlpA